MENNVEELTKLIQQANCITSGYPEELAEFLIKHGVIIKRTRGGNGK